jgi:hypothetical protein
MSHLFQRITAAGGNRDPGAFPCQALCNAFADAATATRDDRHLAV